MHSHYIDVLFVGIKENALSKNHFSCNLYRVQLCTDWTKMGGQLNYTSVSMPILIFPTHFDPDRLPICRIGATLYGEMNFS